MAYDKCTICGEWGFNNSHVCPPVWETNIDDYDGDEWFPVYATDAEEATKKRAVKMDAGDYGLLDGGRMDIAVRKQGETEAVMYECWGEAVPEYHAERKTKTEAANNDT